MEHKSGVANHLKKLILVHLIQGSAISYVHQELFAKENVCGFCESWCIRKHFLVLFLINH